MKIVFVKTGQKILVGSENGSVVLRVKNDVVKLPSGAYEIKAGEINEKDSDN